MLRCVVLRCIVFCVVLSCVVLCCVAMCRAMLRCVALCCVVLCGVLGKHSPKSYRGAGGQFRAGILLSENFVFSEGAEIFPRQNLGPLAAQRVHGAVQSLGFARVTAFPPSEIFPIEITPARNLNKR